MKDVSAEMPNRRENTSTRLVDVLTAAFEETAKLLEEKKAEAQLLARASM